MSRLNESNKKRRSLKPIQVSANSDVHLVRDSGLNTKKMKTESKESEIKNWLTSAKVENVGYWKTLAEERRSALETALKENEELASENELLKAEIEHWKKLAKEGLKLKQLIEEMAAGEINVDDDS